MPENTLQAEYIALAEIARSFTNEAYEISTLITDITSHVEDLIDERWSGQAGRVFSEHFQEYLGLATMMLSCLLADASEVMLQIIRNLQEADQQPITFVSNGPYGVAGNEFAGEKTASNLEPGSGAKMANYTNGVDGWSLIKTVSRQGFTPDNLVVQRGRGCALYTPPNFLGASRHNISQADADHLASQAPKEECGWRPDLCFGDDPIWFRSEIDTSETVIKKSISNYQRGNLREGGLQSGYLVNIANAEQFLVRTVQSGKLVLVDMRIEDSFGIDGERMAAVVGVKTGENGQLESVLVATNCAGGQIYEIAGNSFTESWIYAGDCEYMIVDRAQAPKTSPVH
jgi:uncharacterized protein YukE